MATYENRYSVVGTSRPEHGLTLYEARKVLIALHRDGLLTDATHATETGSKHMRSRPVAFFSRWTETVLSMFGATNEERSVLSSWENPRARDLHSRTAK